MTTEECAGCHTRWTDISTTAHCTVCHELFSGPEARARHRVVRRGHRKTVCLSPREILESGLRPRPDPWTNETVWTPLSAPGAPDGPRHPNGLTIAPGRRSGPPRGIGGIS